LIPASEPINVIGALLRKRLRGEVVVFIAFSFSFDGALTPTPLTLSPWALV
jgi:hypothetical protein